MRDRWNPPRGAVRIVPAETPRSPSAVYGVECSACGWTACQPGGQLKVVAQDEKGRHRCPPGTPLASPTCPTCGSTSKACATPRGTWHPERGRLYDEAVLHA